MNTLNNTQQLTDKTLDQATGGGLWCASSLIRKTTTKAAGLASATNVATVPPTDQASVMDDDAENFTGLVALCNGFFKSIFTQRS